MPSLHPTIHRLVPLLLAASLACVATACKSAPQTGEEGMQEVVEKPVEPRSITLTFVVTDDVAADLNAPPTGQMRGALFHTGDVGAFGPKKGAEAVAKMEPRDVDLSADTPPSWTTPELSPGEYTFLGFVDLDNNSPDGPDDGDIVTRPPTNRFDLSTVEDPLKVRFDYIKGSTIFG